MLAVFGVVTYLAVRVMQRLGDRTEQGAGGPRRTTSKPRTVAPDDDPDFLRELDRRRRRARRPEETGETPDDSDS